MTPSPSFARVSLTVGVTGPLHHAQHVLRQHRINARIDRCKQLSSSPHPFDGLHSRMLQAAPLCVQLGDLRYHHQHVLGQVLPVLCCWVHRPRCVSDVLWRFHHLV